MAERLLELLGGYVRFVITGEQAERFLNLCRNKGIVMTDVRREENGCVKARVSLKDFFGLGALRRKTGVKIHIVGKCGMPFFFFRNKKRKAFFLGILLCAALLLGLSTRIWNIHIEGNIRNSTPQLIRLLEDEGIVHGMAKADVGCAELAATLRRRCPDITWVSARLEGTRLILNIQEGKVLDTEKEQQEEPCNLQADKEGTIVSMVTRQGVPLVKPGDTCSPGDILISGELHILNDSQEIVRYEYVQADADIFVRRRISYYKEFPMEYERVLPAGEDVYGIGIGVGPWYVQAGGKKEKNRRLITEELPLYLTESFCLPVVLKKITGIGFRTEKAVYTEEEAREAAGKELLKFEEELLEKGIEICENNVQTTVNQTSCITKGTLVIVEKTGMPVPVVIQPQKQEEGEDYLQAGVKLTENFF